MDQVTVAVPEGTTTEDVFSVITPDYDLHTSLCGRATQLDTLSYEVATSLSTRLPRIFTRGGEHIAVER